MILKVYIFCGSGKRMKLVLEILKMNHHGHMIKIHCPKKLNEMVCQYTCDDESECDEKENAGTHTVTFKCIGASKYSNSQKILKLVSELLSRKCDVPVDIFPEPDNPFDSRAIAFKARIENKWHTIGYVVREATEAVHDVMSRKAIVKYVKFAWAKYLILWSRSWLLKSQRSAFIATLLQTPKFF